MLRPPAGLARPSLGVANDHRKATGREAYGAHAAPGAFEPVLEFHFVALSSTTIWEVRDGGALVRRPIVPDELPAPCRRRNRIRSRRGRHDQTAITDDFMICYASSDADWPAPSLTCRALLLLRTINIAETPDAY